MLIVGIQESPHGGNENKKPNNQQDGHLVKSSTSYLNFMIKDTSYQLPDTRYYILDTIYQIHDTRYNNPTLKKTHTKNHTFR